MPNRWWFARSRSVRNTGHAWTQVGEQSDPEETILERLRVVDQAKRRAEAHARIAAKRRTNPVEDLLALLERPEYRIDVDKEILQLILDSYPEDD